jgi:hypothetical protein
MLLYNPQVNTKFISAFIFAVAASIALISYSAYDFTSLLRSRDRAAVVPKGNALGVDRYPGDNWKTYNDPLGYEFQYPPDWTIRLSPRAWMPDLLGPEVYLRPKEIPNGPPPLLQIDVRASIPSDSSSICSNECSEVCFNGEKAKKVASIHSAHEDDFYTIVRNDKVYTIWYQPWLAEYGISEAQAKAVLGSFKISGAGSTPCEH